MFLPLSFSGSRKSRVERIDTEQRPNWVSCWHRSPSSNKALFKCQSESKQHRTRSLGKGELIEELTTYKDMSSIGTHCKPNGSRRYRARSFVECVHTCQVSNHIAEQQR
jgi:hypothetical protein